MNRPHRTRLRFRAARGGGGDRVRDASDAIIPSDRSLYCDDGRVSGLMGRFNKGGDHGGHTPREVQANTDRGVSDLFRW